MRVPTDRVVDLQRRRALAGGIAALVGGLAAEGSTPGRLSGRCSDGQLLAACRRLADAEREMVALLDAGSAAGEEELDFALNRNWNRQVSIAEEVCSLPATTAVGRAAKAAAYVLIEGGQLAWSVHSMGLIEDRLLQSLLSDLVGGFR